MSPATPGPKQGQKTSSSSLAAEVFAFDRNLHTDKILPPVLSEDSTVAIIALEDTIRGSKRDAIREYAEELENRHNFHVTLSSNLGPGTEGHSEHSSLRSLTAPGSWQNELLALLVDESTDMIHLAMGADNGIDILKNFPVKDFIKNPKIVAGGGRATALLNGIYAMTGVVTFLSCEPRIGDINAYMASEKAWSSFDNRFVEADRQNFNFEAKKDVRGSIRPGGVVTGPLVGGDIDIFANLIGTRYMPPLDGAILLIQATDLKYKDFEFKLFQLAESGVLSKVKAIIFGKLHLDDESDAVHAVSTAVSRVIPAKLKIPICYNFDLFGHKKPGNFLGIGSTAQLNIGSGSLSLHKACSDL